MTAITLFALSLNRAILGSVARPRSIIEFRIVDKTTLPTTWSLGLIALVLLYSLMGNCWTAQLVVEEETVRNNVSSEMAAGGDVEEVQKMPLTPPGTPEENLATRNDAALVEEKKMLVDGEQVEEGDREISSLLPTKRKQQIVSFIAGNDGSNHENQATSRRKGTPRRSYHLKDSDSPIDTRDAEEVSDVPPYKIDNDILKESVPNETDDAADMNRCIQGKKCENLVDSAASSPAKSDSVLEKLKLTKVQLSNAYEDNDKTNSSSISSKARRFFGLGNLKAKYSKKSDVIKAAQSTDQSAMNEIAEPNDENSK